MLDLFMLQLYQTPFVIQYFLFFLGVATGITTLKIITIINEPRYPFAKATPEQIVEILNKVARGGNAQ